MGTEFPPGFSLSSWERSKPVHFRVTVAGWNSRRLRCSHCAEDKQRCCLSWHVWCPSLLPCVQGRAEGEAASAHCRCALIFIGASPSAFCLLAFSQEFTSFLLPPLAVMLMFSNNHTKNIWVHSFSHCYKVSVSRGWVPEAGWLASLANHWTPGPAWDPDSKNKVKNNSEAAGLWLPRALTDTCTVSPSVSNDRQSHSLLQEWVLWSMSWFCAFCFFFSEPGDAPNNSPSILAMLETLQNAPSLEVHKDMIRWLLKVIFPHCFAACEKH